MSLELDFQTLVEDSDHLKRCAENGVGVETPGVAVVVRRWGLDQCVATESIGETIEHGIRAGARGTVDASARILSRFRDWSGEYIKEYGDKLAEYTSKAATLQRTAEKLKRRRDLTKELLGHDEVETGSWTSKVCLEDKVDVSACISLSNNIGPLETMTKKYTVLTRSVARGQRVRDDALRPLGRSTNWAVKRSAGLMGIVNPFGKVEAYSLPGNVVVVEHGEKVSFAVARDGDYGHTLPRLSLHEIDEALSAAFTFAKHLDERGTKRGAFSYSGVHEFLIEQQKELEHLEGDELKSAVLQLRNAVNVEDAITTAFVRVAEGLLEYVTLSLK